MSITSRYLVTFALAVTLTSLLFPTSQMLGQEQSASTRETLKQYIADLQKSPDDQALREKIIKLAITISPPPVIPEAAERFMARGKLAMDDAKDSRDSNNYENAVREFENATLAAPWLANAYYNLAVARRMTGQYGRAAQSLKLYLLAAPDASDAQEAKRFMYEMEYKHEKAEKERVDAAAKAEAERVQKQAGMKARAESFEGHWYSLVHGQYSEWFVIERDLNGRYTLRVMRDWGPKPYEFTIERKTLRFREDWSTADREYQFTLSEDGSELRGTGGIWQRPTEAQIAYLKASNRERHKRGEFDYGNVDKGYPMTLYRRKD